MRILCDTNIHLRVVETAHGHHAVAKQAIRHLISRGHELVVFPQVAYEFWSVSSSPLSSNGLGHTIGRTLANINRLLGKFTLTHDVPDVFDEWLRLVSHHGIEGEDVHDAHLVASMQAHGITHILTFNGSDFAVYSGITILDPHFVTAVSQP